MIRDIPKPISVDFICDQFESTVFSETCIIAGVVTQVLVSRQRSFLVLYWLHGSGRSGEK